MKRKFIWCGIILSLLSFTTTAQIDIGEETEENYTSTTEGFFVKNGALKIDALECYDFDNLIIAFDLKKEYFACDRIGIRLQVGNPDIPKTIRTYSYVIDKDNFNDLFSGKEYAYFKLFPSSDLDEESFWKGYNKYNIKEGLKRIDLQYAKSKNTIDNYKLIAIIRCGYVTGTGTVYKTLSDGTVVASDAGEWNWSTSKTFGIDLKNRIYVSLKSSFLQNPLKEDKYQNVTVTEGGCYK